MDSTFMAFLFSAGAVTLAEMGDKTQLLAMAFATKYKASKVLIGVFLATIFNHALAVAIGNVITKFAVIDTWIKTLAAISFIFFGLWTIRGDKLDGEENRKSKYGAVMTVAIAFFIAELGDKTQLATIALAAQFPLYPLSVLMGSTTGMLIADAIGICIGVIMCKRIPEKTIKLVSACAFIFFGLLASYQVSLEKFGLSFTGALMVIITLIVITAISAYYIIKNSPKETENDSVAEYCKIRTHNQQE